jgi:raffinose/stachyose/melibiose transport system permease protein
VTPARVTEHRVQSPTSSLPGAASRRPRFVWRHWIFLVPLAAFNVAVMLGPALANAYYAFTDWNGLSPANFVGVENFSRLAHDRDFRAAAVHNFVYAAFMLTVPVTMALLGAFLLTRITRFRLLFRTAYFIPFVIASVVNGAIWKYLLSPDIGLAVGLDSIGIGVLNDVYFLGDATLALPTVMFVDHWHWWGFLVALFLAAMQDVDPVFYESARLDGANRWHEFRYITLPSIRPTVIFVLVLTVIWSLLAFDYAFVLTQGGPAGASMLMSILLNNHAFQLNEAGYASAMGLVMTGFTIIFIGGYLYLRRRGWEI